MLIASNDITKARVLVGDVTEEDLRNVDYYVSDNLGIFIPSVGFCQYAIRHQHVHPAYSFVLFFSAEQSIVPVKLEMRPEHYLVTAMSPDFPHEEEQGDVFTRYIAIMISRELYESKYAEYSKTPPGKYEWDQFLVPHEFMFLLKKFMAEHENKLPGHEQVLEAYAVAITHQLIRSLLKIDVAPEGITERFDHGASG